VSSTAAAQVEVHESRVEAGIARMRPVGTIAIEPGATVAFAPGGLHLMLMGLKGPLVAGTTVPLALRFEHAGTIDAALVVGAIPPPPAAPAALAPTRPAARKVPMRIVTLAPSLTEIVYAAGAGERLVGTVDTSDFPEAARRLPRVGDVTRLDGERLVALRPDLVLVWGDGSPVEHKALLTRLRLPFLSLEQHSLADVSAAIEQLGVRFATEAVANRNAAALRAEIATQARRFQGARRLKVFYQVWGTPLYTLGGRHVATEMLSVCGADNIFADQSASAFVVDPEAVLGRDPDVLVLAGTRAENEDWLQHWKDQVPLRAVKDGQVVRLDPDLVNRMGPRIGQGTALLCAQLDERRRAVAAHGR
jgi:iron complex transport system substrate-binding protein